MTDLLRAATAEDLLKAQTVGLVNLNDYRKRRAEALDRKERGDAAINSSENPPAEGASTPKPVFKKKRKVADFYPSRKHPAETSAPEAEVKVFKKKLGANSSIGLKPRVMTKTALQREAQQAEQARQDFILMRDSVKATEVVIPFVFYDGTNVPGGRCRIKKGEQIWLFLDKARKVGAELGVGGDRVEEIGLGVTGFDGPIFDYSAQPTKATPSTSDADAEVDPATYDPLAQPSKKKSKESTYTR
ncbi:unnamed protein product [Alternaria alternata]